MWKPMESAPKDGTQIKARGFNFGDPSRGCHYVKAVWSFEDGQWHDVNDLDQQLDYLTGWHPLPPKNEVEPKS